jgi:hypothetical protein
MALSSKKYEEFYVTTGSGANKAASADIAKAEAIWDLDRGEGCEWFLNHPEYSPLIFQLQQMWDEITSLRAEISSNKDKVSMTLGTSGSTALAGDTALLALGTSGSTALVGDTRLPAFTANDTSVTNTTKSTAITFSNFTATTTNKGTTYSINIIVTETTVVSAGKGAGTTTLTKQGKIPLV